MVEIFLFVAQPFDDAGASEFSFSTMETDSHSKKLDEISQTLALLTKTVKEIQASQKTVEMALQTPEEKLEEKPSLQTLEEKRQQSQEMLADKMVGLQQDLQREIGMLVSPLYSLQPVPESQATATIKVNKISVDFDPYTETNNVVTRKCYRCKQVKDIDCFKRCYYTGKHSYCYVKYIATCSECLEKSSLKG